MVKVLTETSEVPGGTVIARSGARQAKEGVQRPKDPDGKVRGFAALAAARAPPPQLWGIRWSVGSYSFFPVVFSQVDHSFAAA